ncbi:MAG: nuclear transport factor 2 family protein [Ignavibacteria bacterium]|nr:nuclear transport factor 2 family protein [Ignavibacteria bacterium]
MDNPNNENLETVKNWVDAVNANDIKRIISILHPDYEYDLEYSSIKGKDAAEEGWKLYLAAFTDFSL